MNPRQNFVAGALCALFFFCHILSGSNARAQSSPVVTAPAHSKSEPAVPGTPAGQQLAAWLAAFNSGEKEALLRFYAEHYTEAALKQRPAEERASGDLLFRRTSGRFELHSILQSSETEIEVLVESKFTEGWLRLKLEVEAVEPHRLLRRGLMPAAPPPDAVPKGKPSRAKVIENIDAYLNRLSAADVFSGVVLIAQNGRPIFQKAYGWADQAAKVPNSLEKRFYLASMGKMLTSVAIAQLVEQGKLSYTDTVIKHLPDYPNAEIARKVTIHQLLTHTSGLTDFLGKQEFQKLKSHLNTARDFLPLYAGDPLRFEPGTSWAYSNAGFALLGAIIEKLSGQSYYDYITEHLLKPAGMTNTDLNYLYQDDARRATGYTDTGLDAQGNVLREAVDLKGGGSPAGGGFSTVVDFLKFEEALRRHRLLNARLTDLVLAPKVDTAWGNKYAYGFVVTEMNGKRIVGHGGDFQGASTRFEIYPRSGYTVIVFSNYEGIAEDVQDKIRTLLIRE